MNHEYGVYLKVDSMFITRSLTSENDELHSTAITFIGVIWVDIVFILTISGFEISSATIRSLHS